MTSKPANPNASKCFSPSVVVALEATLLTPPTRPTRGTSSSWPPVAAVLDFDIGAGSTQHWDELAIALKELNQRLIHSAVPQCPFPDDRLSKGINTSLFDSVWVQFYNEHSCMYTSGKTNNLLSSWNQWNTVTQAAAPSGGFIPADVLTSEFIPAIKGSAKYGGVMV